MKTPSRTGVLAFLCLLLSACGLPELERNIDHNAIFVQDRLVSWVISISDENWHAVFEEDQATYVPADVEVDGLLYENVGLRLTGNRNRGKLGIRIRFNAFNPALRFHGVKRINLFNDAGDPSLVREALALDRLRRTGIPAPRSSFVWLKMGEGSDAYAGVYTLVEQIDNRFLEDRFGEDDGELYKLERGANLVYEGDEYESYDLLYTYDVDSDTYPPDRVSLIGLMKMLEQASDEELEQKLPRVLDVDGFLRLLAANSWLSNMESHAGTGDNLYLYRDSRGRFRAIPWNLNRAFGNYHGRHCKRAEDERYCTEYAAAWCNGQCAQAVPECVPGHPGSCVEQLAELCAEHHDDLCYYFPLEGDEDCRQNQPEYCEYTTDELLALDPDDPTCSADRPLVHRLLAISSFKERYHEHLRDLIDGELEPQLVEKEMERMRALIAERAAEDVAKDCSEINCPEDFDASFTTDLRLDDEDPPEFRIPGLVPFIQARDEVIRKALEGN
jgi:spore coat protein CotH